MVNPEVPPPHRLVTVAQPCWRLRATASRTPGGAATAPRRLLCAAAQFEPLDGERLRFRADHTPALVSRAGRRPGLRHFVGRPRRQRPGWRPAREGAARLRAALRSSLGLRPSERESEGARDAHSTVSNSYVHTSKCHMSLLECPPQNSGSISGSIGGHKKGGISIRRPGRSHPPMWST